MMSPATWQRVKVLYAAASELPEPDREAFVEREAASEPRARVEALRLLRADSVPAMKQVEPLRLPHRQATRLQLGQLLAGRYLVRRFVAAGGVGEVYEAEDRERAERVALKIFRAEFASNDHIPWLRREVEMARRVRHPNVCRVFDLVVDGGLVFLTMEFLEGETLAAYLRREGALSERRALPLVRQMVAGLAAAHAEGVIHRDFKPGNVMVVPRADGPARAVITDFGMARTSSDQRRTTVTVASTMGFGTPAYMAPEQVSGEPAERRADIYALGVVLYELLTGELPFSDESPLAMAVRKTRERPVSPRRFAPGLRVNWDRAVLRCLDPKPARRFGDVREVLEQLESRRPGWRIAARGLRQRIPARSLLLPAAALLLAACGWIFWPRTAAPETVRQWETGVFALQAGEALAAIQQWEHVTARPLPARAPVDLALAWHALGFPARAKTELSRATRGEQAYAQIAAAWIGGDKARARQLALQRSQGGHPDALNLADAAAFGAADLWPRVATLRPDHGGAQLMLGEAAAQSGKWAEAERYFTLASTHFQTSGAVAMLRAISSRRGLRYLAGGNPEAGRAALEPGRAAAGTGAAPCERFVVLMAGQDDTFEKPDDPIPFVSPRFPAAGPAARRTFDQGLVDGQLMLSFPLPNLRFCSGQITLRMRRDLSVGGGGSFNDTISIGSAPFSSTSSAPLVKTLWATLMNSSAADLTVEVTPELLAAAQHAYAGAPVAFLDIVAGDDTDFDFIKFTLVY